MSHSYVFLKLIIVLDWTIQFLHLLSKLWDSTLHSIHRSIVLVRLSPVKCLFDLLYFSFLSSLWLALHLRISISLLSSLFIPQIHHLNSCSYWCSLTIWFVWKQLSLFFLEFYLGHFHWGADNFWRRRLSFFFRVRWFCPRICLSG